MILQNEELTVEISETGAELQRITVDGEERLWDGDPAFWSGRAPVLFPICGRLKQDRYTFEGKIYSLGQHGFARNMPFVLEKGTAGSATFLLRDSAETLMQYPWHFELRITYRLRGRSLDITYDVKNTSETEMYCSIGAHEAYAIPEGVEEYDIIFPRKETLSSYAVEDAFLSGQRIPIIKETDTLPLYDKYFAVDALVFKDLKSRSLTLRNRKTGKAVTVDFNGFDYLLLWKKCGAGYLCIEPWTGIPPMITDHDPEISRKEGIRAIAPGDVFSRIHTIHF